MAGSTGIQPSTVRPGLDDDRRRAVHRDAEEQVVRHLGAVGEQRDLARRVERRDQRCSGCQAMPRSANAASSAADASGDGGIGTPSGITSAISDGSRRPALDEEVVHQQRRLARRRRALERRRGDADDDPAARRSRRARHAGANAPATV